MIVARKQNVFSVDRSRKSGSEGLLRACNGARTIAQRLHSAPRSDSFYRNPMR